MRVNLWRRKGHGRVYICISHKSKFSTFSLPLCNEQNIKRFSWVHIWIRSPLRIRLGSTKCIHILVCHMQSIFSRPIIMDTRYSISKAHICTKYIVPSVISYSFLFGLCHQLFMLCIEYTQIFNEHSVLTTNQIFPDYCLVISVFHLSLCDAYLMTFFQRCIDSAQAIDKFKTQTHIVQCTRILFCFRLHFVSRIFL